MTRSSRSSGPSLHTVASGLTLVRAEYRPYRVALRTAWQSAQGRHEQRHGYLLRLQTGQGISGYGECAPLPEAGTETLAAAGKALAVVLQDCRGLSVAGMAGRLGELSKAPAVRCALETALLDLLAREQSVPVYRWLAPAARGRVAVNAACGCLDEGFDTRLRQALTQGYRVVKIKLGCLPLEGELERLERLRLPDGVRLRLDANRAWPADQAAHAIEVCNALPVEALEEPLATADLASLRGLQQLASFPLALDESLRDVFASMPVDELPVRRVVLKPMAMGGILPVIRYAQRARQAGIEFVVTSALETCVGLWAALHAAAVLDNQLAHGLGTASWLENPDPALCPVRGMLDTGVSPEPGLPPPAW